LARKILLADDSVTAQNMGRRILTDAGYEVATVNNGSAALKKIAESKPDLIVLDVYMPGYSGLEVCQRIRESRETARIPVLLTVGKLEPFKPDEVRRVKADAFIVKPFEASELLTALTKLEDKIVPQPQPYKPGRFAKALVAAEESAQLSNEFGDAETGWKNRIKIPPPHHKHHEAHSETAPVPEVESKVEERVQAGLSKVSGVPAGLPGDITPEEIAALNAAAAAFQNQSPESTAEPPRETRDSGANASVFQVNAETAPAAATFATASEAETQELRTENAQAEAADVPAPPAAPTSSENEKFTGCPEPVEAARSASEPAAISEPAPRGEDSQQKRLAEHEVDAAFASLPSNGHGDTLTEEANAGAAEPVPVTMAMAGSIQEFSGRRWTAEPITMSEAESSLNLELEMQKSFAAFAAADAAQLGAATWQPQATTFAEPSSPPAAETASFSPEASSSRSESPIEESSTHATEAVAESVVTPAGVGDAIAAPAGNASSDGVAAKEEQAYAAAASAGPVGVDQGTVTEETSPASVPEPENPPAVVAEPRGEAELAAAWANWKQIRDSVTSPQFTSQIADSASATFHDIRREETSAQSESQPEAAASAEDENGIANLVDSVLAELKPKLMQEIAKKMGKEKK